MLLPAVHAFVHAALLLSAEHAGQIGNLNKAVNGFEMYVAQLLYSDDVGDDVVTDSEVLAWVSGCGVAVLCYHRILPPSLTMLISRNFGPLTSLSKLCTR